MQFEPKAKRIGARKDEAGHEYVVSALTTTQSLDLLIDLGKTLGPVIGNVSSNPDMLGVSIKTGMAKELALLAMSGGLADALTKLDGAAIHRIARLAAKATTVDGKPLDRTYEIHFQRRLLDLFAWLAFFVEVQFEDFFDMLASVKPPEPASIENPQAELPLP